jgi:hypothetical protein
MMHDLRDLASLIAPEASEVFHDHFHRKARLHVKSADPERAISLWPWSSINSLIETNAHPPDRFQLIRANNTIAPMIYRKRGPSGPLRAGIVRNLLYQGSTILMSGVDEVVPAIGRLTAAIERELSCRAWTNAYLTFGAGSALKAHFDVHDVVILQVHGRKRWRSYGVSHLHPVKNDQFNPAEYEAADIVWDDILEPGDVLYLPRGEVHVAVLEGDNSVHLTIGLMPCRGLDFAKTMIEQATEDILFRQDIPPATNKHVIAKHESALKEALHGLIDRADLSRYLERDDYARSLRPMVNLGFTGPFQHNMIIEPGPRRRVRLHIETAGEIGISIGGEKFRLSAPARRVLDFLLRHGDCTFGGIVSAVEGELPEQAVHRAVAELVEQSLVGLCF